MTAFSAVIVPITSDQGKENTSLCWKQFSICSTRSPQVSFLSCSDCRVPTEYILAFFLVIYESCGLVAERGEKSNTRATS